MADKKHEIDIASLESVSGGVNRIAQFKQINKEQVEAYEGLGYTVVEVPGPGKYKLNNGQILQFDSPGYYYFY